MNTGTTQTVTTLSQNHQRFVDEYFKQGLNGTQAYMTVYPGSSYEAAKNSAFRLMSNDDLQICIQEKFHQLQNRNEIKIDEIINKINKLIDRCESNGDDKTQLKGLVELAKMLGFYSAQKVEHINAQPLQINIISPQGYVAPTPQNFLSSKNHQIPGINPGDIDTDI